MYIYWQLIFWIFQQKCLSLDQVYLSVYTPKLLMLALNTNKSINQSIISLLWKTKITTCWKVPSTRGINFFLPPNPRVALILYHKRSWLCSIVILRAAICAASSSGKPSSLTSWPSSYIKVIAVIRPFYIFMSCFQSYLLFLLFFIFILLFFFHFFFYVLSPK